MTTLRRRIEELEAARPVVRHDPRPRPFAALVTRMTTEDLQILAGIGEVDDLTDAHRAALGRAWVLATPAERVLLGKLT